MKKLYVLFLLLFIPIVSHSQTFDDLKLIDNLGSQELVTQASLGQMNYSGSTTDTSQIQKGFTVYVIVKG